MQVERFYPQNFIFDRLASLAIVQYDGSGAWEKLILFVDQATLVTQQL